MIKTILCDLGNVIVYVDESKIINKLTKHSTKNKKFIEKLNKLKTSFISSLIH